MMKAMKESVGEAGLTKMFHQARSSTWLGVLWAPGFPMRSGEVAWLLELLGDAEVVDGKARGKSWMRADERVSW